MQIFRLIPVILVFVIILFYLFWFLQTLVVIVVLLFILNLVVAIIQRIHSLCIQLLIIYLVKTKVTCSEHWLRYAITFSIIACRYLFVIC